VVRCGCLLIVAPQDFHLAFLPESLILPRAFPVAISSRAFAKMSSTLLEKANGRPTGLLGCQSLVMCWPE
jgi:hypothetical protein